MKPGFPATASIYFNSNISFYKTIIETITQQYYCDLYKKTAVMTLTCLIMFVRQAKISTLPLFMQYFESQNCHFSLKLV